ncbi:hypothetical protein VFPPC_13746 [Pochonia chlamydosporia 170]|uniref:Uncharacterized protein n=1 Tax=Pochonia chlamydosporia 170 TaxID=1380566 RepID=A0A179FTF4_METCM|nr:hypothetical protein VFPPC_13746 [Pochonia chlamydosporia 170]OAQ68864.1 hypothetical protein VFPPC_13746 [Pochonia chlamydosporia 170]
MRFQPILMAAVLSAAANSQALGKAFLYSKESCEGTEHKVEPNDKCTLLPESLRRKINGAKVPKDVVCDFYTDEHCKEPLLIGMEEPGECSFSEYDIENRAVSVHCYDDRDQDEI